MSERQVVGFSCWTVGRAAVQLPHEPAPPLLPASRWGYRKKLIPSYSNLLKVSPYRLVFALALREHRQTQRHQHIQKRQIGSLQITQDDLGSSRAFAVPKTVCQRKRAAVTCIAGTAEGGWSLRIRSKRAGGPDRLQIRPPPSHSIGRSSKCAIVATQRRQHEALTASSTISDLDSCIDAVHQRGFVHRCSCRKTRRS